MLAPEATGGVPLFACAPLTPEPMRRPEWVAHPNGALGIASVTVAVDDPAACYDPMAQVFGSICLTETDDTLAVHTGQGVLLFVTPDDLDMLHPELARSRPPSRADAGRAQPHGARSGQATAESLARRARRRLPARPRRATLASRAPNTVMA